MMYLSMNAWSNRILPDLGGHSIEACSRGTIMKATADNGKMHVYGMLVSLSARINKMRSKRIDSAMPCNIEYPSFWIIYAS